MKLFDVYPLFDIEIVKGEGCYTYDAEGNQIKMVSEEKLPDGYVDSLIVTTEYELYCIEQ